MRMWSQFPILIWTLISSLVPLARNHSQIVKFLRLEKNLASTSLWTYYLCLNSMMKQKYNVKLQDSLASPCWSKATTPTSRTRPRHHLWWVCILACEAGYFHLCLLQGASPDGVPRPPPGDGGQEQWRLQDHSRCKQRSDQRATAFLVLAQGGFVAHALANTWQRSTVTWTSSRGGYGGPRPRARYSRIRWWGKTCLGRFRMMMLPA